jgi:16S rRNA processing protein RimM
LKKTNKTNETVLIGKVGSPVGIKGEVRITLYAQDSTNLKEGKVLLLERAEKTMSTAIERLRFQKDRPVVKLEGVDDRNAAEEIRGMEVSIYASDLEELPEGEHYVRDLIGCRVVDIADNNKEVGVLRDVIQNTAQSILEVETSEGKSVLIPAVDAFLKGIDEEAGVIEVELIPGFLD